MIGAAHRRREQPCQDASMAVQLTATDGSALQLMAVADGHGNQRHWLSGTGSQLACRAAERAVRQALATTPLPAIERWRQLLRQELPEAIVQDWLAATAADWAERPESGEQPFSPLPYGSTLGLVLLAPRWWGCTGLGDWDLVRIAADGRGELVSEEAATGADGALRSGEATASLCLPGAADLFAERAQLHPLPAAADTGDSQALVLSSDGMRKSCLADADFLQLCGQLRAVDDPAELEAGLAQITAEGSGDDVSVAMASWDPGLRERWEVALPHAVVPAQASLDRRGERITGLKPRGLGAKVVALLLVLLGGGLAAAWWWWSRPRPPVVASAGPAAVAREVERQCAAPERIRANLNQRRTQFAQLHQATTAAPPSRPAGPEGAARLQSSPNTAPAPRPDAAPHAIDAERDPLGALIAASRRGPVAGCVQLEQELRLQWQRAAGQPPQAGQPGRMPAETGRPAATPPPPTRQP
ncbi:MAG: protein phosphatase 2C domain-containing protein [Vulcanococcus sp.]